MLKMSLQTRLMKIVERDPKSRWRHLLEASDYLEVAFPLTPEQRNTMTDVKRAWVLSPSVHSLLIYLAGKHRIEDADEAEELVRQKPPWWRWRALKLIVSFNRHFPRVCTSAEVNFF